MKDNQSIKYTISPDNLSITFERRGGLQRTFDLRSVHPDNLARAVAVGFAQVRIVDAAAVGRADKDGNIIPEAERLEMKWERMLRLIEHYESGSPEWNLKVRAAQRTTKLDDIRQALSRLGVAADKIAVLADDKLRELAKGKRVAEQILEIERERLSDRTDADGLLDELIGGEEDEQGNEPEEALI